MADESFLKSLFSRKSNLSRTTVHRIDGVMLLANGKEEKKKLTEIVKKLKQIETGRKALNLLAEKNVPLCLKKMDAYGCWIPEEFKIALGADRSVDRLCSTLIHEVRHLHQHANGANQYEQYDLDLKSQIMNDRAREADSQAWAMRACQEWKEAGDAAPYDEFKRGFSPIEAAFSKALAENGNVVDNRVMTAAFKGWYAQESVTTAYEKDYMLYQASRTVAGMTFTSAAYRADAAAKQADGIIFHYQKRDLKSVSPQKIVGMYLDYFTESPSVLEQPAFLAVRAGTKEIMQYAFDRTGRADKTCATLPETNQGFVKEYYYNGYLTNTFEKNLSAHLNGAIEEASFTTKLSCDKIRAAVAGDDGAKAEFTCKAAENNLSPYQLSRLALMKFECDRMTAFNRAMDFSAKAEVPPRPTQETRAKDFNKIKADFLKGEIIAQTGAFILDYSEKNPAVAQALWTSKVIPAEVKKTLKNDIFDGLPKASLPVCPVLQEDADELKRVEQAIAARVMEMRAAEKKSADKGRAQSEQVEKQDGKPENAAVFAAKLKTRRSSAGR